MWLWSSACRQFLAMEGTEYPAYVRKWKTAMQEAYNLASKSAQQAAKKGKRQSDKQVRSTVLSPGDRVLVRNLSPRGGPGKLRAFWEEEIHVVSRKGPESPVYNVTSESGNGKIRTPHRNFYLLPNAITMRLPATRKRHTKE